MTGNYISDYKITNNSAKIQKSLSRAAFLISCCLAGVFFSFIHYRSEIVTELCFLALIVPAVYCLASGLANINITLKTYRLALLYLIPLLFSYIFSIDSNTDFFRNITLLMNIFFSFFLASLFGSRPEHDLPYLVMRRLMFLIFPIFIYVALTQRHASDYTWGRWMPDGMQPNWWGMMSLGLAWCALTWKSALIRFVLLALSLYFMISVQSRGSIVAFLPAFFFASGWFYPLTKKNILRLLAILFLGFLMVIIWGIFSEVSLLNKFSDFLMNDVMRINDQYRGLNSGMTGRTEGYQMAWKGFLESPVFGKGFGAYSFVHNGFLLTLAESGIFAFMGMLYLFYTSIRSAIKGNRWINLGYLISYSIALMTFPRSFNINMTGILLLLVMMTEISHRYIPRKLNSA
ncbi:MAG: O-antigen ligase family protein [Methylococcales bacterium]|nr:O-antigen ligase family protein [Methylococcales bacterium]